MFRYFALLSMTLLLLTSYATTPALAIGFGGYYVASSPGINIGRFRPTSIHMGGFNSGGIHSSTISIPGIHTGGVQLSPQQRLQTPLNGGFTPANTFAPNRGLIVGPTIQPTIQGAEEGVSPFLGPAQQGVFPFALPSDFGMNGVSVTHAPVGSGIRPGAVGGVMRSSAPLSGGIASAPLVPTAEQREAVRYAIQQNRLFTPAWYNTHEDAWFPGESITRVTGDAIWPQVVDWLKLDSPAFSYDYGDTFQVQDGMLYHGGDPVAPLAEYAGYAAQLAASGSQNQPTETGQAEIKWLPLGQYGVLKPGEKTPGSMMQLWVGDKGQVRGTLHNLPNDEATTLTGAVDPRHQRLALQMPGGTTLDAGLYNLTQDNAPALTYNREQGGQQWLLLRNGK